MLGDRPGAALARHLGTAVVALGIGAILTQLGLHLLRDDQLHTSVWWPLAGAEVALVIRLRSRTQWPAAIAGLALGQFAGNVLSGMYSAPAAAGAFVATTAETLVICLLLDRAFPHGVRMDTLPQAVRFALCGLSGITLGSLLFATSQQPWILEGWAGWADLWSGYFRTHAIGLLLISPVFLVTDGLTGLRRELRRSRANLEWAAQVLATIGVSWLVFMTEQAVLASIVCALPLLWGGLRLGVLRALISLQVMAVLATLGTLAGNGPLGDQQPLTRTLALQSVLASLVVCALLITLTAQTRAWALTASQARAHDLAQAERITGTGSAVLTLATGEVAWSEGLYRQLDLDPATVRADPRRYLAAIHPDDRERLAGILGRLRHGHRLLLPTEYRLVRADGEVRHVISRTDAEEDADGRLVRLHTTVHDVTDIRTAEAARRAADSDLAAVLGALTETAIIGVSVATQLVTRYNRGAQNIFGWTAEEVVGKAGPEVFHPLGDDGDTDPEGALGRLGQHLRAFTDRVDRDGRATGTWTCVRRDGTRFLAQIAATLHPAPGGSDEYIAVLTDVSETMRTRAELMDSEDRFRLAFDGAPLAMVITQLDPASPGVILRVNAAMCAFAQKSQEELLGTRMVDLIAEPYAAKVRLNVKRLAAGEIETVHGDRRFHRAGGGELWGRMSTSAVRPAGRRPYLITMIEDITARRELTERLRHEAAHDSLTGLPNRSSLRARLDRALERQERLGRVAVLYIDLDGFKAVNDSEGHGAGDELLIQVADRIAACVRASDVVARIGGDEFAVLCPGVAEAQTAITIGHDIIAVLAAQFELTDAYARIGASVGVAVSVDDDTGPALLEAADEAMYQAKRDGKGRVRVSPR